MDEDLEDIDDDGGADAGSGPSGTADAPAAQADVDRGYFAVDAAESRELAPALVAKLSAAQAAKKLDWTRLPPCRAQKLVRLIAERHACARRALFT